MGYWLTYVKDGLAKGQQVFRRVILENLVAEIESTPSQVHTDIKPWDAAVHAQLLRDIAIERKRNIDLKRENQRLKDKLKREG